jgi:hypothetical protein
MGEDHRLPAAGARRLTFFRWAIVVAAAALALIPFPHALVERFYSTHSYVTLQRPLTVLSNRVPFALFDLLLVLVIGGWLGLAVRDIASARSKRQRRRLLAATGAIAARTVVWAAALYVVFLIVWGLNYRRTPLIDKLPFDRRSVTPDAARALALTAVGRVNDLHAVAHASGWPDAGTIDPALAASLARVDRSAGGAGIVTVGRPKATLLDWYFRRTATDGMTDPYFLETLVSTTLLPLERPFVVAHEWSHLAGVADEGDANFFAWLACVHASPPAQYSGWLYLYGEVSGVLPAEARAEVAQQLGAGPRADLAAIRARVVRDLNPRLAAAGQVVYDKYLKANRIEAGVESYGRVVQLVLGVRFGPGWTLER